MLNTIKLHNVLHFTDETIEFDASLNIITGESGSGKSVLLNAIDLLSGKSAPSNWAPNNDSISFVEGIFDQLPANSGLDDYLDESGILIVRRYLNGKRTKLASLNSQTVPIKHLKEQVAPLFSVAKQHQHHALSSSAFLMELLDAFQPFKDSNALQDSLSQYRRLQSQLSQLSGTEPNDYELDYLTHQIRYLNDLDLKPEEEDSLQNQKQQIKKLAQNTNSFNELHTLTSQISQLTAQCTPHVTRLGLDEISSQLDTIEIATQDIQSGISKAESESVQVSKLNIEEIEARLHALFNAKLKFKVNSVPELLEELASFETRLEALSTQTEKEAEIKSTLVALKPKLDELSDNYQNHLNSSCDKLITTIKERLSKMGFSVANLSFSFSSANYIDSPGFTVKLLLSTQPGKAPAPLNKVASGGELSRLFLAILSSVQLKSGVTYLFDEIDAGIGGEIANAVGHLLAQLSQQNQIICITHLPQIAKLGKTHYGVSKYHQQGEITGAIRLLKHSEKSTELKRMVGGDELVDHLFNLTNPGGET